MIYKLMAFTLLTGIGLAISSGCSTSSTTTQGNTALKNQSNSTTIAGNSIINAGNANVSGNESALTNGKSDEDSSDKDSSKFLAKAMQDGMAEIQVCQLALKQAESPDVKKFAQDMITQHTQIDQEASRIAKQKNITMPTDITAEQKSTFEDMKKLSGKSFDKKFMEHNVSDHKNDVKDFKEQMEQGTDADIKAFAAKTLTTLQTHLGYSTEINDKIKS